MLRSTRPWQTSAYLADSEASTQAGSFRTRFTDFRWHGDSEIQAFGELREATICSRGQELVMRQERWAKRFATTSAD